MAEMQPVEIAQRTTAPRASTGISV
jgi:hypothetical protein